MPGIVSGADLRFGLRSDVAAEVENAGLLDLAERCYFLYQQALYANVELTILRELCEAPTSYNRDVLCAPCFFSFARMAIVESCFMNCARLFDGGSDISIDALLKDCKSMTAEIDARACALFSERPGFDKTKPIRHTLAADEERFFRAEVDSQRSFESLCNVDSPGPALIYIDAAGLIDLWYKRLNGLKKLTSRLREQRNKVFAHSDFEALDYDGLSKKFSLKVAEMQQLIDFALDCVIETSTIISKTGWPRSMHNADDLRGLLNYVDIGMKWVEKGMP